MNKIKELLLKDSVILGIILAIVIFFVSTQVLLSIDYLVVRMASLNHGLTTTAIVVICLALNLIVMRYYFSTQNTTSTAKGILLVTFILIISFFALRSSLSFLPEYIF